jgi:Fe(3+) dicitrate transport protein
MSALGRFILLVLAVIVPRPGAHAQGGDEIVLSGVVQSAAGAPVGGARVQVTTSLGTVSGTRADGEGRFLLRSAAGAAWYDAVASAPDHAPAAVRLTSDAVRSASLVLVLRERVLVLAPVAVFGTGPEALRGVPGATQLIDRAQLQRHRPIAAHELLRHATGVHVQDEDGLGLHLNIGIRGLDPRRSSRVLLLEDGVPIHLGPYTDPSSHYQPPAEALHRVEVVKGAGQIAHGPQTVGGVINFVRRPPTGASGGSLMLRGGNRGQLSGHALATLAAGPHSAAISFGRRQTEGAQRLSDHTVTDGMIQTLFDMSRAGSLLLKGGVYFERSRWGEAGLTQAEYESDPRANPSPADVFEMNRYTAQGVWERSLGVGRLTTILYAQDLHRVSWRQANSSEDRFGLDDYAADFACPDGALGMADCGFQGRPRDYRFAGIEPRLLLDLESVSVPASLEFGVRLHGERAERRQFVGPVPGTGGARLTRDNALTAQATAAFVQSRLRHRGFTFSPGIRVEHVRTSNTNVMASLDLEDAYTQWLPGAGLSWDARRRTTVFVGMHRGFAPPRPADVLSPSPGQSLVQVEPEVSWNQELGLRTRPADWLELDATLFRIDFENQIVSGHRTGAGQRFVNAGSTLHQGMELHARAEAAGPASLRPFAAVAYTLAATARFTSDEVSTVDGETPLRGRRLPYAPRHTLHAEAGVRTAAGLQLTIRGYHVSGQYGDDLNSRQPSVDGQRGLLPAYTVLGATLNRGIASGRASAFLAVENLADATYISARQEGIMAGPPRRIAAGIEWLF